MAKRSWPESMRNAALLELMQPNLEPGARRTGRYTLFGLAGGNFREIEPTNSALGLPVLYPAFQECPLRCSLRNREAWYHPWQTSTLALLRTRTTQQLT